MRLAVEADESAGDISRFRGVTGLDDAHVDEGKKSAVIEAANSAGELYKVSLSHSFPYLPQPVSNAERRKERKIPKPVVSLSRLMRGSDLTCWAG